MIKRPTVWWEEIAALYKRAEKATGVIVDPQVSIIPAINAGNVLVSYSDAGVPNGFLQFIEVRLPDTNEHVLMERILYQEAKGFSRVAFNLLKSFETVAKERGARAILAGSCLNHNEVTKRLYEANGFKTNYSFRKEIN